MIYLIRIVLLFSSFFIYPQKSRIVVLDNLYKKPLIGIQILTEKGSFIGNTDVNGRFEFDMISLSKTGIKSILIYDPDYLPLEYKIDEIPELVYLEKIRHYELDPIVIVNKSSAKYFTVKGYVRSWKLVNDKLVKYGDAIVEYLIPYVKDIKKNVSSTVIKKNFIAYRNFKIDSIKQRSRIINISLNDGYLNCSIYQTDLLARAAGYYKSKKLNDTLYDIMDEGRKIGYAIYNKNNLLSEINIGQNFEGEDAMKVLFWKVSAKIKKIERWTGNDGTRYPSYVYSNQKSFVETKEKGKFNAVEIINEIFIEDAISHENKKIKKYNSGIDFDRSYYSREYWNDEQIKHPLPISITEQLVKLNENKNILK
jgi:hypothetical protein